MLHFKCTKISFIFFIFNVNELSDNNKGVAIMWIDLFLEKREVRKLVIYQEIMTMQPLRLSALKERTNYTESTILPLLQEIENDLTELTGNTISLTHTVDQPVQRRMPDLHHYRQHLLEHSLVAQVFYTMLFTADSCIKDFCKKQFLSRATVFRKLSVVKEILAPFHLQFNINKLELIGSELAIRYFFCNIFWFLKPHIINNYPLDDQALQEMLTDLCNTFDSVTSVGNKQKFELCLKIGQLRREAGYFIDQEIPQSAIVLDTAIIKTYQEQFAAFLSQNCPEAYVEKEQIGFYFILYSGAIYIHQDTPIYSMFQDWAGNENETYQAIKQLSDGIAHHFLHDQPPAEFDVVTANLTSVFNACVVLNDAPPLIYLLLQKNWRIDAPLSKHVYKYCAKFLKRLSRRKKYLFLDNHLESLTNLFTFFLWPTVKAAIHKQKLTVGIVAEDNFITMLPLYNFFTEHHYVELSPYQGDEDIDLLVIPHHSFYPENFQKQVFHYNYLAIENQFAELKKALGQQQILKYETNLVSNAEFMH